MLRGWCAVSGTCSELEYVLQDAQVEAVLCTSAYAEKLAPIAEASQAGLLILEQTPAASGDPGSDATIESVLAGEGLAVSREPSEEGALIIYTSGTTGRPKGELLSGQPARGVHVQAPPTLPV